ncbi:hypothetical protein [Thermoactinospora rubra]|uniref:hypothetical protein n=1 Tax=Thermoactinospora rubra TaxID=1088767 RepID=UPI00197EB4CE|nr:hypothetical protein [Thermoactinospora rubra]
MADAAHGLWPLVILNTALFALGATIPGTHEGGHLWNDLIGWSGDPRLGPFHLAGYMLIGAGFRLIAARCDEQWRARILAFIPRRRAHHELTRSGEKP